MQNALKSPGRSDEDRKNLEEALAKLMPSTKWLVEHKALLPLLTQLKVLSRTEANRKVIKEVAIAQLLRHISDRGVSTKIQGEGANVVLNICYEKENVKAVLACGGASTLVEFLSSNDEELQANSAGALQSICFQPEGRKVVRSLGAIPPLVELLTADSINVKARAVGALHNISSDVNSIRIIRRKGAIKWLIQLLHHSQPCVCGSAAGALQNVSREVASRLLIRRSDAVKCLINLLQSTEVQTQVCAAGALLNVLGPELCDEDNPTPLGKKRRAAFVKTITLTLVASIIKQTVFSTESRESIASTPTRSGTPVIPKTSSPTHPYLDPLSSYLRASRSRSASSFANSSFTTTTGSSPDPKFAAPADWNNMGLSTPPSRRQSTNSTINVHVPAATRHYSLPMMPSVNQSHK